MPLPRLAFGMCDSAGPSPGLGPLGRQGPAAGDIGVLGQTESLEPIGRQAGSGKWEAFGGEGSQTTDLPVLLASRNLKLTEKPR